MHISYAWVYTETTEIAVRNVSCGTGVHLMDFHSSRNTCLHSSESRSISDIALLVTKNSFTCDSVSVFSSSYRAVASGISLPCFTLMSASLFSEPPTPSGEPLPCPYSKRFQVPRDIPYADSRVENRKKLVLLRY